MIGFIIIVCVIAFIIEVKSEKEKEKVKQINDELSARENRIYDKDKYNYAYKNSFMITIGENLKYYQTGIEISLNDILMSNELKISIFYKKKCKNHET